MVLQKPVMSSTGVFVKPFIKEPAFAKIEQTSLQVSIVTQFFPPDYAATGQLLEELVRHLGHQGVNVSVFTGQPGYAFETSAAPSVEKMGRVSVQRSRMAKLWPQRIRGKAVNGVLFLIRALLHLLKAGQSQQVLLVTTAPPFLPILGYVSNVLFGLPYVCLLYDLYPDIAIELDVIGQKKPVAQLWRWINRQVWQRAAAIIVLSPSMKQRIVESCPSVASKVSVIHSWADASKIIPIPKAENWFAQRHQLVDPFVVLYSGNMGRCHDIDTLFAAAEILRDEPIRFVCIGGGAKCEALMQSVAAANLRNFLFLPYQEKSVLPYSLTACNLSLVSITTGMEDLVAPSKLYSAMAAGRPVAAICPPQSYLGSLLKAAGCGETFDNGDVQSLVTFIRKLQQDSEKAQSMGTAGRRYMQAHFTPELIAKEYLDVLCQALSQSAVKKMTVVKQKLTAG